MKALIIVLALSPLFLIGQTNWSYSTGEINWKGYGELGGFFQEGTIQSSSVDIDWEQNKPIAGEIVIDMKTIHHDDKSLKKHLKAKDFFNTKKYPEAKFQITEVEENVMKGELTLCGYTFPESIVIEIEERGDQLFVKGTAEIDRTKYGIKYNSKSFFQDLGSYAIKNNFDLSFSLSFVK